MPLPRPGRTRAFHLLTALPHPWARKADAAVRRGGPARVAAAPMRWWLHRGASLVTGGPARGLRLSLAHLPVAHAQARLLARGLAELPVQEALRRTIAPGAVVYDVGANVGFFTVLAARFAGPEGTVVAFEPAPECAASVRANAAVNGFESNIRVVEAALGASAHRERLFVVADASWSRLASRGEHSQTDNTVEVDVLALDELVARAEIPPPDVVKIDVEGSELDVLQGMRRTLAEHRPAIVVEFHETNRAVAELLAGVGYAAENLDGPGGPLDAGPNDHVLARPVS
jgi:FkbM family methyltransferase